MKIIDGIVNKNTWCLLITQDLIAPRWTIMEIDQEDSVEAPRSLVRFMWKEEWT